MNIDLRICQIKEKIRNNNISFDYFVKCFDVLNSLISIEHYKGALSFANTLKMASVMIENRSESQEYFKYYNDLLKTISELENKLQVKNVKIR
ncbi:MAG: hypothetical protein IJ068_06185 [Bacilli bacterium]|nr:hypothetical protein [Bacilli bacterium]